MKKILGLILKILPIITIWQGVTSGGARMKPFIDTIKVALTQYEVAQITKAYVASLSQNNGQMLDQKKFSEFIQDQVHSQYSVLAREITGDKSHDHAKDIWGKPFQLIVSDDQTQIKIASSGPDGKIKSKDDIGLDFSVQRDYVRKPASVPQPVREVVEDVEQVPEETVADDAQLAAQDEIRGPASDDLAEEPQNAESYDVDGFGTDGYDQDGYDRNGIHRSEKQMGQPEEV